MDLKSIEDRLTGSTSRINELYCAAFHEREAGQLAKATKKQNRTIAVLILLVFVIMVLSSVPDTKSRDFSGLDLARPGSGDSPKTIEADISAEYDGFTARQRAQLRILPMEVPEEEAEALLRTVALRLPNMILGENASLGDVRQNLVLPVSDAETGAEISWSSSDPRIISKDGKVNLVGAEQGAIVTLTAHISLASAKDTFHISIVTGEGMPEASMEDALRARVAEAVKEASGARDGETASLPSLTEDGVKLTWASPESNGGLPGVFGCAMVAFFLFSRRYNAVRRNIEKARSEMERDFPDFIQKLGLMLGAGLVITSAVEKITEDYLKMRDVYGRRRLYEELSSALERMKGSGTSLIYEFSELARRSGLRELMRFSSTLSDNVDKGSTLKDKLRAENELLWEGRKKRAEKEGRLAETKLIFPMALQILAVIAITVMPAAFEMG